MTSNDDDNSGPSSRDTFLRYIREDNYALELAGKVELQKSRPGEYQYDKMEKNAWEWERFKHLAFTSGALAGFAAFTLTRKSTTLISQRFGHKPSFNQLMVPSVCIGSSMGTAVAFWNRNDCVALVKANEKLPLRPGHSVEMDEYCPSVLLTLDEAFKTHPDAVMMKEMPKTFWWSMLMASHNSCARRMLYSKILRHEQGLGALDHVSIPESGVPEMEELLLMMKKAGLNDSGVTSSNNDHPERDRLVGAPDRAFATNGNLNSIPSALSEKNEFVKRIMMEQKLVLDVVESIELDTNNVGKLELQPDELRFLRWEGFKSRFNNLEWSKGVMYGIGAFVVMRMLTKGSDKMVKKLWVDFKPSKWVLPFDAGMACIVGTYLGCIQNYLEGEEMEKGVPDLVLRSGRSPAADEYCPLVIKHMVKAFDTHPHAHVLENPQTRYGQIIVRARDNCERRIMYEAVLRREQGLGNGEPVTIPKPGVPELDVLKSKSWRSDDNDGNDVSIQIIDASSAQRLVTDQDKEN
jgi:hypothetical protein